MRPQRRAGSRREIGGTHRPGTDDLIRSDFSMSGLPVAGQKPQREESTSPEDALARLAQNMRVSQSLAEFESSLLETAVNELAAMEGSSVGRRRRRRTGREPFDTPKRRARRLSSTRAKISPTYADRFRPKAGSASFTAMHRMGPPAKRNESIRFCSRPWAVAPRIPSGTRLN